MITRVQAKRIGSQHAEELPAKRVRNLQGRKVDPAPARSSFGWKLLTITGICLLALGLMFVPVAMASPQRCVGDQCHQVVPYVQQSAVPGPAALGLVCESMRQSPPRFSENLPQYMIKGYRLTPDGKGACALKDPPEPHQKCIDLVEEEQFYSDLVTGITEEITGLKATGAPANNEKGIPGIHAGVNVEINPQRLHNYQKALKYAENKIVQDAHFFEQSDDAILDTLKAMHQFAMKDLIQDHAVGVFRDDVMIVGHTDDLRDLLKGCYLKINLIGTPEEVALIKKTIPQMYQDIDTGIMKLTPDERRAWDKVLYIGPLPDQVEPEMRYFVQQLKRYHNEGMPAAQLACFAHNEIGRIHAFADGNGRLGMILLNSILKRAGISEIVIPNESDYTRKVLEDGKKPGSFCRYIEERVIPWTNAHRKVLELDV